LASNGLLEALVYASICAEDIAGSVEDTSHAAPIDITFEDGGSAPCPAAVQDLRDTMTRHVGVLRNEDGLKSALCTISALEAQTDSPSFLNMCATATLIAASALIRKESRGAHERTDFPNTDPDAAERSRMSLTEALVIRKQVQEEKR
jgi:L-aspartate oxidase